MSFAGLTKACDSELVRDFEVEDEVEDEREAQSVETWSNIPQSSAPGAILPGNDDIEAAVVQNSREVAEGTDREYRRCVTFLSSFPDFYTTHTA
jgi:hypothetical protein